MPRKSAAARMTPQVGERPRLQPPTTGLSTRERQLFRDVVGAVKPEHFCAEDTPLLTIYVRGLSQCETAAREIASGSTDKFWLELQASGLKAIDLMTRKLRLGALSRAPHNQRGPRGTAESGLPLPWQNYSHLHAVPDDCRDQSGERSFARLREQMQGVQCTGHFSSPEPEPPAEIGTDKKDVQSNFPTFQENALKQKNVQGSLSEGADIAAFVGADQNQ